MVDILLTRKLIGVTIAAVIFGFCFILIAGKMLGIQKNKNNIVKAILVFWLGNVFSIWREEFGFNNNYFIRIIPMLFIFLGILIVLSSNNICKKGHILIKKFANKDEQKSENLS